MKAYRPLKTNRITQGFGENKLCVKTKYGAVMYPLEYKGAVMNSCPVGYMSIYKLAGINGHNGLDFLAWHGEPVFHSVEYDGWIKTEVDNAGGIGVNVISNEPVVQCKELGCTEKHYVKTRYWHLMKVLVHDKQQVSWGLKIGLADNTGQSSGDHLHFDMKYCDKDGNKIHENNGYYGCFNPSPHFDNVFVGDVLGRIAEGVSCLTDAVHKLIFTIRDRFGLIQPK